MNHAEVMCHLSTWMAISGYEPAKPRGVDLIIFDGYTVPSPSGWKVRPDSCAHDLSLVGPHDLKT